MGIKYCQNLTRRALSRVEMIGICGSDVEIYKDKEVYYHTSYRIIMGHEVVRRIEEIEGIASERHGFKKGDRAIILAGFIC